MKNRSDITNSGSSKFDREANVRNQTTRRTFLQAAGLGAAAYAAHGAAHGAEKPKIVDKYGNPVQGFVDYIAASPASSKGWKPVSDRKIRVGLVGYGFCQFGAALDSRITQMSMWWR